MPIQLDHFELETKRLRISGLGSTKCESANIEGESSPIIAVHGWLDNAASFIPLAKHLNTNCPFYAIELPGHGASEHRSEDANYHLVDNIVDLDAVISYVSAQHGVSSSRVTLIGHSLGGIICSLYAAARPELVEQLILLDSLGPLTDELESVLPQLRKAVIKAGAVSNSKVTIYPSIDRAVKVRQLGVGRVSADAARLLCERGMKDMNGGFVWSSDSRLLAPSFVRFSEEQVRVLFSGIECPTHLLVGDQGYFSDEPSTQKRLSYFSNVIRYVVSGGHHFHMDGDVMETARIINSLI